MSVKNIRTQINIAISALHQAKIEFDNTPEHRKYLEVSKLMLQVDDLYIKLKVLDMNAKDTLRKVLIREGKNPNSVV